MPTIHIRIVLKIRSFYCLKSRIAIKLLRSLIDYWMVKVGSGGTTASLSATSGTRKGMEEEALVEEERVLSASPNTFSDKVVLHFTLTRQERVSLKVYVELGQQIATLYEGEAEMGKRTFCL